MSSTQNLTKGLVVLLILTVLSSFKQDVSQIRQKVVDALGMEQVKFLEETNPDLLKYYFYFIENSFYIEELPAEKFTTSSGLTEIDLPLTDNSNIDFMKLNILKYKLERNFSQRTTYKVKGINSVLVFYSEKELSEMFSMEKEKIKLN